VIIIWSLFNLLDVDVDVRLKQQRMYRGQKTVARETQFISVEKESGRERDKHNTTQHVHFTPDVNN
jgi:hypothetical protein